MSSILFKPAEKGKRGRKRHFVVLVELPDHTWEAEVRCAGEKEILVFKGANPYELLQILASRTPYGRPPDPTIPTKRVKEEGEK